MDKVRVNDHVLLNGWPARVTRKGFVQIVTEDPANPCIVVHKSELIHNPQYQLYEEKK